MLTLAYHELIHIPFSLPAFDLRLVRFKRNKFIPPKARTVNVDRPIPLRLNKHLLE